MDYWQVSIYTQHAIARKASENYSICLTNGNFYSSITIENTGRKNTPRSLLWLINIHCFRQGDLARQSQAVLDHRKPHGLKQAMTLTLLSQGW